MCKVYISGPMTGLPNWNREAFFAAAALVKFEGHEPINPADGVTEFGKPWEWYMRRALRMLMDADEIWMLPGWERSQGAQMEHLNAVQLKMPIRYVTLDEMKVKRWMG